MRHRPFLTSTFMTSKTLTSVTNAETVFVAPKTLLLAKGLCCQESPLPGELDCQVTALPGYTRCAGSMTFRQPLGVFLSRVRLAQWRHFAPGLEMGRSGRRQPFWLTGRAARVESKSNTTILTRGPWTERSTFRVRKRTSPRFLSDPNLPIGRALTVITISLYMCVCFLGSVCTSVCTRQSGVLAPCLTSLFVARCLNVVS